MSRPSSRGSQASRPQTPQPRPPTPPASTRAGVTVPMGGVAWMGDDGKAEVYTSVGGFKQSVAQAPAGKLNLFTRGMTACFTVIIVSGHGAMLSHVTAYLGQVLDKKDNDKDHVNELKAMRAGFERIWAAHKKSMGDFRVLVIDGENTRADNRDKLMKYIFAEIANAPTKKQLKCEELPNPREARHGTAQVWVNPREAYMEDRRVL